MANSAKGNNNRYGLSTLSSWTGNAIDALADKKLKKRLRNSDSNRSRPCDLIAYLAVHCSCRSKSW